MRRNKKQNVHKRHAQKAQKKRVRRKTKAAQLRRQAPAQIIYRPGISEMEAPKGFRHVGMAQAMMEYGEPLRAYSDDSMQGFDTAFKMASMLWNHAMNVGEREATGMEAAETIKALATAFKLEPQAADELRQKMVKRYWHLFPAAVQPAERTQPFIVIRNELNVEIAPFPYGKLTPNAAAIQPDADDRELLEQIRALDRHILEGSAYEEYERLLEPVKDLAERCFKKWLTDKGVAPEFVRLSECLHIYFDFVYAYTHDDELTLRDVSSAHFEEFFEDFLLRKLHGKPQEYVDWPPALKLFYGYLGEIGYMNVSAAMARAIDNLEFGFMRKLRKYFGA